LRAAWRRLVADAPVDRLDDEADERRLELLDDRLELLDDRLEPDDRLDPDLPRDDEPGERLDEPRALDPDLREAPPPLRDELLRDWAITLLLCRRFARTLQRRGRTAHTIAR